MVLEPSYFQRQNNMTQTKHFGQKKKYRVIFLFYSRYFFFSIDNNCAAYNAFSHVRIYQGSALAGLLIAV